MQLNAQPNARSKKRRIVTPARREQNCRAQRAYRQRQKGVSTLTLRPNALIQEVEKCDSMLTVHVREGSLDLARTTETPVSVLSMLTGDHFFAPSSQSSRSEGQKGPANEVIISPDAPLYSTYTRLLAACVYNAAALGINVDEFSSYNCMSLCSPFYRPNIDMSDDPRSLIKAVTNSAIPALLQPTLPQILFPHHPLFDLLPLPALRARAITLAATSPSLFDLLDFKRDIVEKGGIQCSTTWGSQPWDVRTWTIAPWFSTKWRQVSQALGPDTTKGCISEAEY
ncbi:hypothetical protein PDE_01001 [Penicillium oxalicum 114-2]|uniref:BZIP domain-containing protein n=1 Tax=Penicillium oxalicum (strain 114-2 / CGMCC 5302) TaxID=933388 RepID=S7Z693_PENO1|nr:hypothetical protein PDE_01001 [Penicillium oxalicum 114-2]